jgi:hypothetical protein
MAERFYVLFTSSFRYEAAPNISHETVDKQRTLCGRTRTAPHRTLSGQQRPRTGLQQLPEGFSEAEVGIAARCQR